MDPSVFRASLALPEHVSRELDMRHDAQLDRMLPVLGPLFSGAVILFAVWDYWRDPDVAGLTLSMRVLLVAIGLLAYLPRCAHWRWALLYGTHASALIVAEYLLRDGFLYGLSGITSCVFAVSVMTLRPRAFFAILALPSALLVALSALRLPWPDFINQLMLYVFAVSLALTLMYVIRSFARQTLNLEAQLLETSRRDSLTGVYNRGYLFELAQREVALSQRHARPLAVALLDIDFFKCINDQHGHAIGDEVIRQLARTCMAELRTIDHFGRIGGEEFVCVLPETDRDEALLCAERLRGRLAALAVPTERGPVSFTVSIGVAMLDARRSDWRQLLIAADHALYMAKHQGRNQVALAA